jgi:hypothetical protein
VSLLRWCVGWHRERRLGMAHQEMDANFYFPRQPVRLETIKKGQTVK